MRMTVDSSAARTDSTYRDIPSLDELEGDSSAGSSSMILVVDEEDPQQLHNAEPFDMPDNDDDIMMESLCAALTRPGLIVHPIVTRNARKWRLLCATILLVMTFSASMAHLRSYWRGGSRRNMETRPINEKWPLLDKMRSLVGDHDQRRGRDFRPPSYHPGVRLQRFENNRFGPTP